MGYYTQFQLTMVKNEVDSDHVLSKQAELNAKSGYVLNSDGRSDSWKWYDHVQDMCKLSKEFLRTVFKLHGEGEEATDFWNKYFHNGKLIHEVRPTIELPVPDLTEYN